MVGAVNGADCGSQAADFVETPDPFFSEATI